MNENHVNVLQIKSFHRFATSSVFIMYCKIYYFENYNQIFACCRFMCHFHYCHEKTIGAVQCAHVYKKCLDCRQHQHCLCVQSDGRTFFCNTANMEHHDPTVKKNKATKNPKLFRSAHAHASTKVSRSQQWFIFSICPLLFCLSLFPHVSWLICLFQLLLRQRNSWWKIQFFCIILGIYNTTTGQTEKRETKRRRGGASQCVL